VRVGPDVSAVVANGLGGGSLINAVVMAEPGDDVFQRREWPRAIRDEPAEARRKRFTEMRLLLGAALRDGEFDPVEGKAKAVDNTVERDTKRIPLKYQVLQRMARESGNEKLFIPAPITVALTEQRTSSAGVKLANCLRCGDCATGCNHGAKDSPTSTFCARQQAGATIYTGAMVLRLAAPRQRRKRTRWRERSQRLILTSLQRWTCARDRRFQGRRAEGHPRRGYVRSTEILLRSGDDDLVFSSRLGQRFRPMAT
jgi:ferredoxin